MDNLKMQTGTIEPNLRILIVDDNPAIHKDFMKILTRSQEANKLTQLETALFGVEDELVTNILPNFEIDTVSQGQEGVARIEQALDEGKPYALAFVDIRMPPGWDGVETIKHIWELDKNIQVVICTAYSDYTWEETVKELGEQDNLLILKKPFDTVAVRQLACALTKKWLLMQETKTYMHSLEDKIKERTMSLEKSLSLTRATIESTADGILVVNDSNKIVDYNVRFVEMWNVPKVILEVQEWRLLLDYLMSQVKTPEKFIKLMEQLNENTHEVSINEIKFKDGRVFECYSQPHKLKEHIIGRVWSFRDISKRVDLEHKLQYRVSHDQLTNLPNRLAIMEMIYESLIKLDNVEHKVAILFIDLDRFKLINDSLSHAAGDILIKTFAERLKKLSDDRHVVARLGGDEFVVLIKDFANQSEIVTYAQAIQDLLKTPFTVEGRSIVMAVSIGVSLFPQDGKTANELLHHADAAMYHAKELGGNQVQFYREELDEKALLRLEQETELRKAIADQAFFLCYQPEVDLISGKLKAIEVLIRWQHPTKGTILPMDFIPLAEETGMIVPLGEWILRTACQQSKEWQVKGLPPIKIAVNITTTQFKHPNFAKLVEDILKETGLDPRYLEIEVTENTIVSDPIVTSVIRDLKALGVTIMLDDFGTGYSSLSYLKKLPLDGLKIDKSFIQNITHDYGDEVIIRAIISMAHSLNLDVVAEGVEFANQLNFLKAEHCIDVQGFYFSQPISADEMEVILQKTYQPTTD